MNPNNTNFAPIAPAAEMSSAKTRSFLDSPPREPVFIPSVSASRNNTITPTLPSESTDSSSLHNMDTTVPLLMPKAIRATPMTPISVPRTRSNTDDGAAGSSDQIQSVTQIQKQQQQQHQQQLPRLEGARLLLAAAAMLTARSDDDDEDESSLVDSFESMSDVEEVGLTDTMVDEQLAAALSTMGTPMHQSDDEDEGVDDIDLDSLPPSTFLRSSFSYTSSTSSTPFEDDSANSSFYSFSSSAPSSSASLSKTPSYSSSTTSSRTFTPVMDYNPRKRMASAIASPQTPCSALYTVPSTPPNTPGRTSFPVCSVELEKKLRDVVRKQIKTTHLFEEVMNAPLVSMV
ncbi:hypothetical protein HDU97_007026 [Phlyctochytrium planicorne]|nr:hypothetical protein HDU97_007026 [Phlyctochytrium planicorne]